MGVSFQDGSPLSRFRIADGRVEMNTEVIMKTSGRQTVNLNVSMPENGIWTIQVDLRNQLGRLDWGFLRTEWFFCILFELCVSGLKDNRRANEVLKDVDHLRVNVAFGDISGDRSYSEFILISYYSPSDHFIKVSSSTREAKVCSSFS